MEMLYLHLIQAEQILALRKVDALCDMFDVLNEAETMHTLTNGVAFDKMN